MSEDKKMKDEWDLENMKGVGPVSAKKMKDAGIANLFQLSTEDPVRIAELLNQDKDESATLVAKAREILVQMGDLDKNMCTAKELLLRRADVKKITTGSQALDDFLYGGIETQSTTELFGINSSGKTQFCHTMCVNVQLPESKGGLDAGALYIDTENTFRPERITQIAKAKNLDPIKVLDKIMVGRAYNASHQFLLIEEIGEHIINNNIRLIIMDSIMGNLRPEYVGRGLLAERQQLLNRHLHRLNRLAEDYRVAVIYTNQAVASPDTFYGDPTKATGGNITGHANTYRIQLQKSSGNIRIAKMVDSPIHPPTAVKFVLDQSGIIDTDDYKPDKERPMDEIQKVIDELRQSYNKSKTTVENNSSNPDSQHKTKKSKESKETD